MMLHTGEENCAEGVKEKALQTFLDISTFQRIPDKIFLICLQLDTGVLGAFFMDFDYYLYLSHLISLVSSSLQLNSFLCSIIDRFVAFL
jgi:hypothetical protein